MTGWRNRSLCPRPVGLVVGHREEEDFDEARRWTAPIDVAAHWQATKALSSRSSTGKARSKACNLSKACSNWNRHAIFSARI